MYPTIEINLKNIKKNWLYLDRLSKKNTETGAVVKANAYGFGSKEIALALNQSGCNFFYVAQIEEGIKLRELLKSGHNIKENYRGNNIKKKNGSLFKGIFFGILFWVVIVLFFIILKVYLNL